MARRKRDYTVLDAAKDLAINRDKLEQLLRSGDKTFGYYVSGGEGKHGAYYVYRKRVETYITAQDMQCVCPYVQTTAASGDPHKIK